MGKSPVRELAPVVLLPSVATAWAELGPWLICELVIVEAIFNVSGIGYYLIRAFQTRNTEQVVFALVGLLVLYGIIASLWLNINRWIGRRWESYG